LIGALLILEIDELVERRVLLQITPELISSIEAELVQDLQHMLRKKALTLQADEWRLSKRLLEHSK
jgi:hypothetical protein